MRKLLVNLGFCPGRPAARLYFYYLRILGAGLVQKGGAEGGRGGAEGGFHSYPPHRPSSHSEEPSPIQSKALYGAENEKVKSYENIKITDIFEY